MNKQALIKAASFCAYQERTQQEVRERLKEWEVVGDEAEEVIAELIAQNYLNEERFARIFAGSKFRQKGWGRIKIRQEMKMRKLSEYCIKAGLSEIEDEDYWAKLEEIIQKKNHELRNIEPFARKKKVVNFALSRGFEQNLIWEALKTEG
jgi:regulatory protein